MAKNVIQGDSIAKDWTSPDVPEFDISWTGVWAIVATIGSVPLATGSMTTSDDGTAMLVRVLPADTNTLAPGEYFLISQISNATLGFRREVGQERIVIKQQGIAT